MCHHLPSTPTTNGDDAVLYCAVEKAAAKTGEAFQADGAVGKQFKADGSIG